MKNFSVHQETSRVSLPETVDNLAAFGAPKDCVGVNDWDNKEKQSHLNVTIFKKIKKWSCAIDSSPNSIIQGDNLSVLSALTSTHSGKVKCTYIDPPIITAKFTTITKTRWAMKNG